MSRHAAKGYRLVWKCVADTPLELLFEREHKRPWRTGISPTLGRGVARLSPRGRGNREPRRRGRYRGRFQDFLSSSGHPGPWEQTAVFSNPESLRARFEQPVIATDSPLHLNKLLNDIAYSFSLIYAWYARLFQGTGPGSASLGRWHSGSAGATTGYGMSEKRNGHGWPSLSGPREPRKRQRRPTLRRVSAEPARPGPTPSRQ